MFVKSIELSKINALVGNDKTPSDCIDKAYNPFSIAVTETEPVAEILNFLGSELMSVVILIPVPASISNVSSPVATRSF